MSIEEFYGIEDFSGKIDYFNERLLKGQTVTRIRDDLNLSEKGWQKQVKENGYKYDTKTKNYIKVTEVALIHERGYKSNSLIVNNEKGYEGNPNVVVTSDEYKRVIKELQDIRGMYSKFEEMYQWYELQQNVVEKEKLSIKANDSDIVTRSFKIYGDVYKDFMDFCKEHKEYKVQDIVSHALKEIVNKYK